MKFLALNALFFKGEMPEQLPEWTPFEDFEVGADTYRGSFNSRYVVMVLRPNGAGPGLPIQLIVIDRWQSARHDWRDFQRIKNELVGAEQMMYEIYPPESRLVDSVNNFHLWGFQDMDIVSPHDGRPIGWEIRGLSARSHDLHGVAQRPFELRPHDLSRQQKITDVRNALVAAHRYDPDGGRRLRNIVGRNEPCPCGSGRKFKRCCAKVIQNAE